MLTLIYILTIFGGVLVLVFFVGSLLPKKQKVKQEIEIHCSSDQVFKKIADFREFVTWSPWSKKDPAMKQTFEGEFNTVGASYSWSGNRQVKTGKITTLEIVQDTFLKQELVFADWHKIFTTYELESQAGNTKLRWSAELEIGPNPVKRFFGLLLKKFVEKDFREGLQSLKYTLEH